MGSSLFAIIQAQTGELFQTIGLVLDVIGVLIIVDFFKKIVYREDSPYGIPSNLPQLLTNLANKGIVGSYFLVVGFAFQLIGVWWD